MSNNDSDNRVDLGASVTFTATTGASNGNSLTGDATITLTLPADLSLNVPSISAGGSGSVVTGATSITWTLPVGDLGAALSFDAAVIQPSNASRGGSQITVSADITANAVAFPSTPEEEICVKNATASNNLLLVDNIDDTNSLTQNYFLNDTPSNGSGFATGSASTDATLDAGEGEFIAWQAEYTLPSGNWADFTFFDDLGTSGAFGLGAGISGGSVVGDGSDDHVIFWDANGSNGSLAVTVTATGFAVNLADIGTALGDPDASGLTVRFDYQTTYTDQTSSGDVSFIQRATLRQSGLGAGNGNQGDGSSLFTQGDFVRVQRAEPVLTLSTPATVTVCKPFTLTLTLSNNTDLPSYNLSFGATIPASYTLDTSIAPVFSGSFGVLSQADSNVPTFTLNSLAAGASGTVALSVYKNISGVGSDTITGFVDYDSEQTRISNAGSTDYNAPSATTPALIATPALTNVVTPVNNVLSSRDASWRVYVINTSNGPASNLIVTQPLPSGFTFASQSVSLEGPNTGDAEAITPGAVVFDSGAMRWTMADGDYLLPGQSLVLDISATLDAGASMSPTPTSTVTSTWGCDLETVAVTADQTFSASAASLAVHWSEQPSSIGLGTSESLTLHIQNTGAASVYDGILTLDLTDGASGEAPFAFTSGNLEYRTRTGNTWQPTFSVDRALGASSSLLITADNSGTGLEQALAVLAPVSSNSGINAIEVRFRAVSHEAALPSAAIAASLTASQAASGDSAITANASASITVAPPVVTISLDGPHQHERSDTVSFTATITNTSPAISAHNLAVRNLFPEGTAPDDLMVYSGGDASSFTVSSAELSPTSQAYSTYIFDDDISTNGIIAFPSSFVLPPDTGGSDHIVTVTFSATIDASSACINDSNTTEVSWGTNSTHFDNNTTPLIASDSSDLLMVPDLVLTLSGTGKNKTNARVEVILSATNNGASATNTEFTYHLPNYFIIDDSVPESSSGPLSGLTRVGNQITFTSATIGTGQTASVEFSLHPDPTNVPFEDVSASDDPTPPAIQTASFTASYDDPCSAGRLSVTSASADIQVRWPNLDISSDVEALVMQAGTAHTVTFTLTNGGNSFSKVASGEFRLSTIGPGLSITDVVFEDFDEKEPILPSVSDF